MEIKRAISGYEGIYDITSTGRIYSHRSQKYLVRCNDEYGFNVVSLWDANRIRKNLNVFKLWQVAFPELRNEQFKGALRVKYMKECRLSNKTGIHF